MIIKKNMQFDVRIESFGALGEGIARIDGVPIFISNALPGEKVTITIVKADKKYAFGKKTDILEISEDREIPRCPYYGKCGGCTCQHMNYKAQLTFKQKQVEGCMRHIAGLDVDVKNVIGAEDPWHYRNKISMPVTGSSSDPQIGYYAPRSHRVIDVHECLLAKKPADKAAETVRKWMVMNEILPYNEESHEGLVRHIMMRVNQQGRLMLVLVINGKKLPAADALVSMMRKTVPETVSVCISRNEKPGNVILGDEYSIIWGDERLEDTLCGNSFLLSPLSFFQVNPPQTEKLYETVLEYAALRGSENVTDLYCGAGTISLLLAKRARHVTGIEIVDAAVRDARVNAVRNHKKNTDFICGAAEKIIPDLISQGMRPDTVVMDPPRKGADAIVLDALVRARPEKIVYVSCNPATLARDAKVLVSKGYGADVCQPVDMFCQTSGIETVCLFKRRN